MAEKFIASNGVTVQESMGVFVVGHAVGGSLHLSKASVNALREYFKVEQSLKIEEIRREVAKAEGARHAATASYTIASANFDAAEKALQEANVNLDAARHRLQCATADDGGES